MKNNIISVHEAHAKTLQQIYGLLAIHLPDHPAPYYLVHDIEASGEGYTLTYYTSEDTDCELLAVQVPGTQPLILPDNVEDFEDFL